VHSGFTVLDGSQAATEVPVVVDGDRVLIDADDVARATGWHLKPEGLCRDDVCVPLRDPDAVNPDGRLDLARFAAALRRPLAVDVAESAAFLGTAAADRAEPLRSLHAPDFTLPDLQGRMHSLHEHRGKKVLLVAYASW
jgi:hypothetical protein